MLHTDIRSNLSRTVACAAVLLLLGLAALVSSAHGAVPQDPQDSTRRGGDTVAPTIETESAADAADSSLLREYRMTKSPTAAVLYSIVPGGGQVYNEQYLKAAAFFGAGAFFASQAVYYHQRFTTLAAEVDAIPIDSVNQRARPRALREFYRDNRDLNVAYFIAVQILSMIDAYVGAHLFDFDVSGGEFESTARMTVDPWNARVGVRIGF